MRGSEPDGCGPRWWVLPPRIEAGGKTPSVEVGVGVALSVGSAILRGRRPESTT